MISRKSFEKLSGDILDHIIADPELLRDLMAESGLSASDLRAVGDSPDLGAALLDFVCASDARLIACARAIGWTPEKLAHLRQAVEAGALG